jgi:hypothetical protein
LTGELLQFLDQYPEQMRELIIVTRRFVLDTVSVAVETVDPPSRLIAFGKRRRLADTICTIMP